MKPSLRPSPLFIGCLLLNEIFGSLLANCVDVADFVLELDPVALVCNFHQLWSEGRGDELSIVCQSLYHCWVGGGENRGIL